MALPQVMLKVEPSTVYGSLVTGQLFGPGAEVVVIVRSVVVSAIMPVVVSGPVVVSTMVVVVSARAAVVLSSIAVVVVSSLVVDVVSSTAVLVFSSTEVVMLSDNVIAIVVATVVDESMVGKTFDIDADVSRVVSRVVGEILELVNPVGLDETCELRLVDAKEAVLVASFDVLVESTIAEEAVVDVSVFPVAVDSLLMALSELIVSAVLDAETVLEIVEVLTPTS